MSLREPDILGQMIRVDSPNDYRINAGFFKQQLHAFLY